METLVDGQETVDQEFWGLVSFLNLDEDQQRFVQSLTDHVIQNTVTTEKPDKLNIFQRISESTWEIVTVSNLMDAVALPVGIWGSKNLDTWPGIVAAAVSFSTDLFDGPVARKLHTTSKKGEFADAVGDKIKIAYALRYIWELDLAPKWLVKAVIAQQGANAALTVVDKAVNGNDSVLHSTKLGKKAYAAIEFGLGLHVIGSKVAETKPRRGEQIKAIGTVLALGGVAVGGAATYGYAKTLFSSRSKRK